jgi:hypothetical protein
MVEIEGENMRLVTVCIFEEVPSGGWAIAGKALTTDDARALARAARSPSPDPPSGTIDPSGMRSP